ncbi:hypothetical protein [Pararhodobacter zhoushanensis]|uniref:DUF5666 domain-containing protein n=1 Tax=Pararhodobacter zhoushanensis TaxID=2479545 RepID=A0ABT3GUW3_9RHOB|nr:hypothetical protein [Pararhodobacter zhoushanensis]MCW1931319.1 hypothetical protein [Pararhodobacter zhoushanensis]
MTHFATTAAVAAFVALSAVAANAADLRNDSVRAGDVYSARELATAGLTESDVIEFTAREQVQVRAGNVYTSRELKASGLDANDTVTVSNFAGNGQVETRNNQNAWRADR